VQRDAEVAAGAENSFMSERSRNSLPKSLTISWRLNGFFH
jgi:hypothetical protein